MKLRKTLAIAATLLICVPAVAVAAQAGSGPIPADGRHSGAPAVTVVPTPGGAAPSAFTPPLDHATMTCPACHPEGRTDEPVADDVCFDCHGANGTGPTVYGGDVASYETPGEHKGHAATHGSGGYKGCTSCHDMHGTSTIPGSKMLKDDPAKGVVSGSPTSTGDEQGYGAFVGPVANQRDFCLDCHGGPYRYTSQGKIPQSLDDFTLVYASCAPCHQDGEVFVVDAPIERGGMSHVMTAEVQTGDGQIAWKPSAYATDGPTADENSCTLCHDSRQDFPHAGASDYLISDYRKGQDGVCLRCHTNTGQTNTATAGVGITTESGHPSEPVGVA